MALHSFAFGMVSAAWSMTDRPEAEHSAYAPPANADVPQPPTASSGRRRPERPARVRVRIRSVAIGSAAPRDAPKRPHFLGLHGH
jgi:hypothetical protein